VGAPKLKTRSFFEEEVGRHFIDAAIKSTEAYLSGKPVHHKTIMAANLVVDYPNAGLIHFTSNEIEVQMLLAASDIIAMEMYAEMVGEKPNSVDSDVLDCLGEVTNMVYGYAKAILVNEGHRFTLARPIATKDVNAHLKGKKSLEVKFYITGTAHSFSLIFSL
jgi:chemotaxis protein CheX